MPCLPSASHSLWVSVTETTGSSFCSSSARWSSSVGIVASMTPAIRSPAAASALVVHAGSSVPMAATASLTCACCASIRFISCGSSVARSRSSGKSSSSSPVWWVCRKSNISWACVPIILDRARLLAAARNSRGSWPNSRRMTRWIKTISWVSTVGPGPLIVDSSITRGFPGWGVCAWLRTDVFGVSWVWSR